MDFENRYQLKGAANSQGLPLSSLSVHEEARILSLASEVAESFRVRLRELGFREGALVTCQRNTPLGGPRIYEVSGAIFSLESKLADFIFVEKI